MSYFRLIRLPPQNLCPSGTCCWRKQGWVCSAALSSLRGHNTRGSSSSDSSNSGGGNSEYGGGNSVTWVSWSSPRCHTSRHTLRSDFSAENHTASYQSGYDKSDRMSAIVDIASSSATRRNSNVADFYPHRREISPVGMIYSWNALSIDDMGGEGAYSRHNVLRSRRRVQWTSIRRFAASPPTDKRESSDSTEPNNSQRASLNQRASQGGLLKPTDKEIEPVKDESAPRFKDLQEEYKLYQTARKNPRQASEQVESSQMALTRKKAVAVVKRIPVMTWNATKALVMFLVEILKNPRSLRDKIAVAQHHLLEFGRHYWLGCKLLWNDIQTANKIMNRILRGFPMTRRERKQLLRTASDIFRMVPLAAFVLIPFMEFLLPVALRIFPNMLPSTFQDSLKEEEKLKKELRLRMAYAGFLQETVTEMAMKRKTRAEDGEESEATTAELTEFIEKAKMGEITNHDIPKFAKLFKDELTLDNISRSGLVNMCRYMGLAPFGSDNFLRFQLRAKLRAITQDDQRILWEGVSSLTKQELQEACRERGMRATGLTKQGYVRQLSQWLDLSTKKSVPISLLIMSRAFTLHAPDPAVALAQSISSMDDDVVTEVMIEAASSEEQKTAEYRTRKLESLSRQNELIEEENRKLVEAKEAQVPREDDDGVPVEWLTR